jgi:UDP-glucose 4-epimerase
VTGGAGFIGTHLCRTLVAAGHAVRTLDIAELKRPVAGVEAIRGDVRDPSAVAAALRDIETVYHLAAIVSVALCQEKPVESYATNLGATALVLELMHQERLRAGRATTVSPQIRFVFASSSAVYGDKGKETQPISEQTLLDAPLSFYAAQKLGSEHAIGVFHRRHGTPALAFRFFNVYGPGQDPSSPYSGVISTFTRSARQGLPLKLNGGGKQTRDFVSVHDITNALKAALDLPSPAWDSLPINLGTGHSIPITTLAAEIIEAAHSSSLTETTPWREGDVRHSCADIRKANSTLGWKPRVTLAEGLREILADDSH